MLIKMLDLARSCRLLVKETRSPPRFRGYITEGTTQLRRFLHRVQSSSKMKRISLKLLCFWLAIMCSHVHGTLDFYMNETETRRLLGE